jgi:hypothetical protein
MEVGIADHAALADLALADFELRLDQGDEMGARRGEGEGRGQQGLEPDEAGVAGDQLDRLGQLRAGQTARVSPFQHHHARILAQLPGQLAAADVDGIDAGRAAA